MSCFTVSFQSPPSPCVSLTFVYCFVWKKLEVFLSFENVLFSVYEEDRVLCFQDFISVLSLFSLLFSFLYSLDARNIWPHNSNYAWHLSLTRRRQSIPCSVATRNSRETSLFWGDTRERRESVPVFKKQFLSDERSEEKRDHLFFWSKHILLSKDKQKKTQEIIWEEKERRLIPPSFTLFSFFCCLSYRRREFFILNYSY